MDEQNGLGEDWDLLKTFFPADWEELARTTQALKGLRQDKSADHLLRTVMLHVGCGYSLRETVVRARESGLADLSDVALLKRLRKCEQCLQERFWNGIDFAGKSNWSSSALNKSRPWATCPSTVT